MARFTRVFGVRTLRIGFLRGLRFRLAVSYVIFFALLLIVIGVSFYENLKTEGIADVNTTAKSDWDAVRGYLEFSHEYPTWQYDHSDPPRLPLGRRQRTLRAVLGDL
jgi:hypothetical protein